ncbi:S8 family serine peptidase, partial [Actinoplanes sp. NPDC051633]|uniref:S8 family serine peptidase n=1 Tax=Actinoplanes sp. NPDC051633 TaxID=3155670 RepID=UPI0034173A2A
MRAAAVAAALVAAAAGFAPEAAPAEVYLVQLSGPPSAAQIDAVASRVIHRYTATFPGFAAELTAREAAAVSSTPGVVAVTRDEPRAALSITTPEFLGLTGDSGAWQRYSGGAAHAGENAIVGFIDSGLAAGHPSFAALAEPRPDAAAIAARWRGACDDAALCNNKVIGARHFRAAATGVSPAEPDSARDYNGHGTHVAAVAAGNNAVPAVVDGLSAGDTSGVAPAARVAVYKALWQTTDGRLVGSTADIVAAIDQATADGVDVLNYSAAGATGTVT